MLPMYVFHPVSSQLLEITFKNVAYTQTVRKGQRGFIGMIMIYHMLAAEGGS